LQHQKNPAGKDEEETGMQRNRPMIKKEKSQKWANTSNSDSKLLEHGKIATTSYHFSPPVNSLYVSNNNNVTANFCESKK